jgi:hypothetical protein
VMIAKVLVSAAIALGVSVGVAAPAVADPNPDPNNPFSGFTCTAKPTVQECAAGSQPKGNPVINPDQIAKALQDGISGVQAIRGQQ